MTNDDLGLRVDEYDLRQQEHTHAMDKLHREQAHAKELEKIELKKARQGTWQVIGIALAVASVLITLALVFFTDFLERAPAPGETPEKSDSQIEQEREDECFDKEGAWLPKETFSSSYPERGMCLYPGRGVDVPEED